MQNEQAVVPVHVGFIVDGNRRWAKKHGLPTYEGHLAGHAVFKDLILTAVDRGVKYLSFYVFSTENWRRSEDEVSHIMSLVVKILRDDIKQLIKEGIRVRVLGTEDRLSDDVKKAIGQAKAKTAHCKRATMALCFNYGGQLEIADAAAECARQGIKITPEAIRQHLYEPDIPDVDMVVRTSGEQRISNFMLWRIAYSELMFLDKFWPDMRPADIDTIIKEYGNRQRRFGGN